MCGCFLADGAGQGGAGGSDWESGNGPLTACLGGNDRVMRPPELDDFPLEQSRDETLKNAYDRVRSIDGQLLQPEIPLSFPYFSLIKERLYRVTQDAQSKEISTQLLIPKSRREMLFQAAHCTPMAGHSHGRQRHVNSSWPDSFGRAFTRTFAGGVRRVVNVSW